MKKHIAGIEFLFKSIYSIDYTAPELLPYCVFVDRRGNKFHVMLESIEEYLLEEKKAHKERIDDQSDVMMGENSETSDSESECEIDVKKRKTETTTVSTPEEKK